ncbi:MAG: alpha-1,2-fucosyltransferase [Chlamydiales bacterium]|nr:alpha-1,2-fucosyltransferase [Chlamydiales bacterium]
MFGRLFVLFLAGYLASAEAKPFVEAELRGQLGNNMFIVATACAVAWDNGADAYFPELKLKYAYQWENLPLNLAHIFFRCNLNPPPRRATASWHQRTFGYEPILFQPNMKIHGYFQTEKYFAHQRARLLDLFAPHPDDLNYIEAKYKWLLEHPHTVGVQLRVYYEDRHGGMFIQYGKDYLTKAMSLFPEEALFIIFSNNKEFAKENTPEELKARVVYIENEPHYIDLFLLSLCKHNIITNSTFGWWGAWLNQNPDKIVIAPAQWLRPGSHLSTKDLIPDSWIKVDAKWGPLQDPTSYQ